MRSILTPCKTVLCAVAFVALLLIWAVVYMAEGALDKLLVWIVNQWPEG
jgi:uncharacterized MAPEG superfamily protein